MIEVTTKLRWRGNMLFAGRIQVGQVTHDPDTPITGARFVAWLYIPRFAPLERATRDGAVKALERAAREALDG